MDCAVQSLYLCCFCSVFLSCAVHWVELDALEIICVISSHTLYDTAFYMCHLQP